MVPEYNCWWLVAYMTPTIGLGIAYPYARKSALNGFEAAKIVTRQGENNV